MEERPRRCLRMRELAKKIGLAPSSIYALLNPKNTAYDPTFPHGVKLGNSRTSPVVWVEGDVEAWLDKRIAQSARG